MSTVDKTLLLRVDQRAQVLEAVKRMKSVMDSYGAENVTGPTPIMVSLELVMHETEKLNAIEDARDAA